MELRRERSELTSYCQLVQELILGTVRRHTFTQTELELLFDLQTCKIRKSSKPEALRRYLRAVHQQSACGPSILRLSTFLDREVAARLTSVHAVLPEPLPQTAA